MLLNLDLPFRLKDEKRVCDIIDKVQLYLEHQNIESEVCRIYMRKIDHLYYKFDPLVLKQKKVKLEIKLIQCNLFVLTVLQL